MKTIKTKLTVTNEAAVRGKALADLIKEYIPGFHVYYGFRNIGADTEKISFPALFVDPEDVPDTMDSTGKTRIERVFDIMFFVLDNNPDDLLSLATSGMEALCKLFSNNALGDIASARTNKFKVYTPCWSNSEIRLAKIGRAIVNPGPTEKETYLCRVGWMKLAVIDRVLK